MIVTTTEQIEGKKIKKTTGMVKGSTIRARHLGKDIMAGLRSIVGGEIDEYTKMLAEAREQAFDRMKASAKAKGADGVVCVRFTTSTIMQNAAELLSYGTAVVIEDEE